MSDSERWRPNSRSPRRNRSRSHSRDRRDHQSRNRSRSRSRGRETYRKTSPPRSHRRRRSPSPRDEPPPVGSIHKVRDASVRPFGAFVDLPGCNRQGLVHSSQIAEEVRFGRDDDDEMKVKALEFYCPRGEFVWIKILDVRHDGRNLKIGCSMRAVDQRDGTDVDPGNLLAAGNGGVPGGGGPLGGRLSDDIPELYSVHSAVVHSAVPFGVFVQMDGYRKYGLVHFSQISDHLGFTGGDNDAERVAAISDIVPQGERVWVKVVDVTSDERGPKVGCSIKFVSQRDGTDLDPGNVKYKPRGEGGGAPGGGGFRGQRVIGAEAGEVRGQEIVDWGYLKADVVRYGGDSTKQYEILGDDEDVGDERGRGGPSEQDGRGAVPGAVTGLVSR